MRPSSLALLVTAAVVAAIAAVSSSRPRSPDETPTTPPPRPVPPPDSTGGGSARDAVVAAAVSQLGLGDSAIYWASAAPGQHVAQSIDWCGGFALWALHQAGLALDWTWQFGSGFLLTSKHHLPQTKTPQPGDVAYFDHNQHHAIVASVDPAGFVELINGNGTHGLVSRSTVDTDKVTAFFSIAPLLPGGAA